MKIYAVVSNSKDDINLIVDEIPKLVYDKYMLTGTEHYIGCDKTQTFYNCLYKEDLTKSGRVAFAGNTLELNMVNGETRYVKNIWWHGGHSKVEAFLNIELKSIGICTLEDAERFNTPSFTAMEVDKAKLKRLIKKVPSFQRRDVEKALERGEFV